MLTTTAPTHDHDDHLSPRAVATKAAAAMVTVVAAATAAVVVVLPLGLEGAVTAANCQVADDAREAEANPDYNDGADDDDGPGEGSSSFRSSHAFQCSGGRAARSSRSSFGLPATTSLISCTLRFPA